MMSLSIGIVWDIPKRKKESALPYSAKAYSRLYSNVPGEDQAPKAMAALLTGEPGFVVWETTYSHRLSSRKLERWVATLVRKTSKHWNSVSSWKYARNAGLGTVKLVWLDIFFGARVLICLEGFGGGFGWAYPLHCHPAFEHLIHVGFAWSHLRCRTLFLPLASFFKLNRGLSNLTCKLCNRLWNEKFEFEFSFWC